MPQSQKPQALHVGFIMDGNGRWATSRGLERIRGHARGVKRVKEIVQAAPDLGLTHLTLYAFSTENWKRTAAEVKGLMLLFRRYIQSEARALHAQNVCVRFIGDRTRLDPGLQRMMADLEEKTRGNTRLTLCVAINYGGRDELARSMRTLMRRAASGQIAPEEVDEALISAALDTHDMPDPDLIIRTSGEQRVSNFLIWQAAYAEYIFTQTPWPDFTPEELARLLREYDGRERRFGGV